MAVASVGVARVDRAQQADDLGLDACPLHADHVRSAHRRRVPVRLRERRDVAGHGGGHADHRAGADRAELVHGHAEAEVRPRPHVHVAGEQHARGERRAVVDDAVMREVALVHDERVVADARAILPALVDLDVLAEHVAVADDDAVARRPLRGIRRMRPAPHLGRGADDHAAAEPVPVADGHRAGDHDVGADRVAGTEGDLAVDHGGGMDAVHIASQSAHEIGRSPHGRLSGCATTAGHDSTNPTSAAAAVRAPRGGRAQDHPVDWMVVPGSMAREIYPTRPHDSHHDRAVRRGRRGAGPGGPAIGVDRTGPEGRPARDRVRRPGRDEARHRRQQRHHGTHRRAPGPGPAAGRRGDHDAVHVRRHPERDPRGRRDGGVRRHPRGRLQHRSGFGGRADHAALEGAPSGAPVRPDGRHGAAGRDRRGERPAHPRGRGPVAGRALRRPWRRQLRPRHASRSTRPRT